jgi:hypothetical protein
MQGDLQCFPFMLIMIWRTSNIVPLMTTFWIYSPPTLHFIHVISRPITVTFCHLFLLNPSDLIVFGDNGQTVSFINGVFSRPTLSGNPIFASECMNGMQTSARLACPSTRFCSVDDPGGTIL